MAAKVLSVVLSYWVISISMVFANKYLVGDHSSTEDVTLFVAWIQCIVTVGFILFLNTFTPIIRYMTKEEEPNFNISFGTICVRPILMLTCTYVSMLTFNNLCLRYVGVAFFQIARSMTLIFTVIMSMLILRKAISLPIIFCCIVVAGGFVLGVDQENLAGKLSMQGVLYGVTTSVFVALNGIFTKKALDVVDSNSVKLTLYNNINAIFYFIPLLLLTGQFKAVIQSDRLTDIYFWGFLLCSGMLSFLIAWISAVQIDVTSPVTHHISANAKAVLQTLLAVMYYQEDKSWLWWCSILLVVSGAMSYAIIRVKESRKVSEKVIDVEKPPLKV